MSQTEKPNYVKQQQDKKLQSCGGMAEAILDAIARGQVRHVDASGGFPAHMIIADVSMPNDEQGEDKLWAASSLAVSIVSDQLGRNGNPLKIEFHEAEGRLQCCIEAFDTNKVDLSESKRALKAELTRALSPMPNPKKSNKPSVGGDRIWLGPFKKEMLPSFEEIMQFLITFHGGDGVESISYQQPDKKIVLECNAKDLRPILLKEGILQKAQGLH